MNSTRIAGVALIPLNLRMRRLFVTALGHKRISRNLLVAVRLSDGTFGYGEASASLAWPDQTQEAMTRALRKFTPELLRADIRGWRRLCRRASESSGEYPTAVGALECALVDAYTRSRGIPLWRWFGGRKGFVVSDLTISAWAPEVAARAARQAARAGFDQLKIKVTGWDLEEDLRRVQAVRRAAPRALLFLDGNQGFTAETAIGFIRLLRRRKIPVRLFEQPVPRDDLEGLTKIEKEGKVPVAADESARSPDDARRLIRRKAVSVISVKLAKSGLLGALEIVRAARASNVKLMISCMAESAIGLSHSVALACGSGAFHYVDLDSCFLVASPSCRPGFLPRGPRLSIYPNRPGSGVEIRHPSMK